MTSSYYKSYYSDIEKCIDKTIKSVSIDENEIVTFGFIDGSKISIIPSEWISEVKYVEAAINN